jgi:hypothetical protein
VLQSVVEIRDSKGEISEKLQEKIRHAIKNEIKIFLDSGAFTVQQIGLGNFTEDTKKNIFTLDGYCDFVRKYRPYFHQVAALDVIGNAEESMENYKHMVRIGLDYVIPAWHGGESYDWLDKYVSMTDYVAIGGLASIAAKRALKVAYIRKAIDRIKSKDSRTKIHLYGVADFLLLKFFGTQIESADSSSWKTGAKWGFLLNLGGTSWLDYQFKVKHHRTVSDGYNVYQTVKMMNIINEYARRSRNPNGDARNSGS